MYSNVFHSLDGWGLELQKEPVTLPCKCSQTVTWESQCTELWCVILCDMITQRRVIDLNYKHLLAYHGVDKIGNSVPRLYTYTHHVPFFSQKTASFCIRKL